MRSRYPVGLLALTVLTMGGWVFAQREPLPRRPGPEAGPRVLARMRWEYQALSRLQVENGTPDKSKDRLTDGLNKLGAEGWELVTIEPASNKLNSVFLFKRPAGRVARGGERAPANGVGARSPAAAREAAADMVRVYALKYARAADVAKTLSEIFRDGQGKPFRLASDQRTNSLVLRAQPDQLREILVLVERLDVATKEGERRQE